MWKLKQVFSNLSFGILLKDLEIEKQKILTQDANMIKCCMTLRNFAISFHESVCDTKCHI